MIRNILENNTLEVNGMVYRFREEFDVNLTLQYENTNWNHWHIVREFVSNALDSVGMDIEKINISIVDGYVSIHDLGAGYPLVYAKRIGASSKKDDDSTIGQFGEGSKMALLTCVRNNIQVLLASQNWLIVPKIKEIEGQSVLMYDIYETDEFIVGSIVVIDAVQEILDVIDNISDYFLVYNKTSCLFENNVGSIYPNSNHVTKLYNKGVFIKDIKGLFSYGINLNNGLNRDRDLLSINDIYYAVRDIWEEVNDINMIKKLLRLTVKPYDEKKEYIECYGSMYSYHSECWAKAFLEEFGENACIATNDIAAREARCLGYIPIYNIESDIAKILKYGGIKEDVNCISADYEFTWADSLTKEEKEILQQLPQYAKLAGFRDIPEVVKVFEEYKNHDNVNGCYNNQTQEVYIKKSLLSGGLEKVLKTYLHETCHYETGCDDLDRAFADYLCRLLTNMLIKYSKEVGRDAELRIVKNTLLLPDNISISANDLIAKITVISNELTISLAYNTIHVFLPIELEKPYAFEKKICLKHGGFGFLLPEPLKLLDFKSIKCKVV